LGLTHLISPLLIQAHSAQHIAEFLAKLGELLKGVLIAITFEDFGEGFNMPQPFSHVFCLWPTASFTKGLELYSGLRKSTKDKIPDKTYHSITC
jgi:hypothetical protein